VAPSKRKNKKKKKKSNLPYLLVLASFGAVYFYWQESGIELFPAPEETVSAVSTPVELNPSPTPTVTSTEMTQQTVTAEKEFPKPESSDDKEVIWDKAVKKFLEANRPAEADTLFAAYQSERNRYAESVELNLAKGLKEISKLNSGAEAVEEDQESGFQVEHEQNLEKIFGDLYPSYQKQRKRFLEGFEDINPTEVEKE
jgi:hypothetical protein